ncbi:hypothetical protein K793_10912, partial [Salmonella enterica subsp. enterica serovar Newport str. SHSN003]
NPFFFFFFFFCLYFFFLGTCVQEYVKLERLQEALSGYSPVIPRVYLADINTDHQH